jgi:hypothetical protein
MRHILITSAKITKALGVIYYKKKRNAMGVLAIIPGWIIYGLKVVVSIIVAWLAMLGVVVLVFLRGSRVFK